MKVNMLVKPVFTTCPLAKPAVEKVKETKIAPVFAKYDITRKVYWVYGDPDVIASAGLAKANVASEIKAADVIFPMNKLGRIEDVDGGIDGLEDLLSREPMITLTGLIEKNNITAVIEISDDVASEEEGESPALKQAWEKAMALGEPFTEEFRETVTRFFALHKIDEYLQLEIVSGYEVPIDKYGEPIRLMRPVSMLQPTNTPNEKYLYGESYAACALRQALDGNPFILTGPKSVGKNFIDEWIAYVLGAAYYETSVDQDMLKSELFGDKVIDATASKHLTMDGAKAYMLAQKNEAMATDAAFEYEYWKAYNSTMRFIVEDTEFNRWLLQKQGRRVLMVNEINYGSAVILAEVFNPVAEDRPVRFVEVPGIGRVYIDSKCILTASMNEGYVGTVELNEAMRSRFGTIEVQPAEHIDVILKDKIESEIGKGVLADAYYKACDKLYVYMLKRASSGGSNSAQYGDKALSLRNFGRALKSVAKSHGRVKLAAQLNLQLRGQCDTITERNSLSDDIRALIGDM